MTQRQLVPAQMAQADNLRRLAREYHEAGKAQRAARNALYAELARLHPGLTYKQLEHLSGLSYFRIRQIVDAERKAQKETDRGQTDAV